MNTNTANTNTGGWAVPLVLRWDQGLQKLWISIIKIWKLFCRCWGEMFWRGVLSSILNIHSDFVLQISNELQSTQDQRYCNERCVSFHGKKSFFFPNKLNSVFCHSVEEVQHARLCNVEIKLKCKKQVKRHQNVLLCKIGSSPRQVAINLAVAPQFISMFC